MQLTTVQWDERYELCVPATGSREHCYRKKAATVGQSGTLSASCNFSFWLIKPQTMQHPLMKLLKATSVQIKSENIRVCIKIKSLYNIYPLSVRTKLGWFLLTKFKGNVDGFLDGGMPSWQKLGSLQQNKVTKCLQ